ncbi:MAG: hypothetical protein ACETV1_05820 [Candidatus Bathyarchaeia archaeon]
MTLRKIFDGRRKEKLRADENDARPAAKVSLSLFADSPIELKAAPATQATPTRNGPTL